MKLLEYKAKELFDKYGVPTMNGCVIDSSENMESEIEKAGLSYPVVVKAQVQIGGRGKAGVSALPTRRRKPKNIVRICFLPSSEDTRLISSSL